jgi:hypothetical protein
MNHRRLWVAATIIALFIIFGFVLSVPRVRDVTEVSAPEAATMGVPSVTLRDSFKKGTHTFTGSIEVSNACASVSAEAALQGNASTTESILVALTVSNEEGICLQVPTMAPFQAVLVAPARLPVTVTVNGLVATTSAL